jgi:6-phosphogluconolactonase (cycloisomerase 2 family)
MIMLNWTWKRRLLSSNPYVQSQRGASNVNKHIARLFLALVALSGIVSAACSAASAQNQGNEEVVGAVYTMTNAAGPNSVAVYHRLSDGRLQPVGTVPTGGIGTGTGLGNQGAITLDHSRRWLFIVNAGSNDISVFRVQADELELKGRFPSGGTTPISLTAHGRMVYVLNAGSPNNITGFLLGEEGELTPIAGSTRSLSSAATNPAEVAFSPDGHLLVVTEKGTNLIDAFPIEDRVPGTPVFTPAHGAEPFGFSFGEPNQLFVSEAFPGHPNGSALSSYVVNDDGTLELVTGSAPTHQTAACWAVVSKGGRFAYTSNTGSSSLTGFRIGADGGLTILTANGRTGETRPGSGPLDSAFSADGGFLYVFASTGTSSSAGISGFSVGSDGGLTPITDVAAPATANGLAAR